jgi:hypothetical protein
MSEEIITEEIMTEDSPEMENITSISYFYPVLFASGTALVVLYYFLRVKGGKKKASVEIDETIATNSVSFHDINYIVKRLHPNSSHMDVLLAIASCPDSIANGLRAFKIKEKITEERHTQDKEEAKKSKKSASSSSIDMFALDNEGWADDDDDEMDEESKRKAQLAKLADDQKKKDQEQLKKATGKMKVLLEGIDAGVIGQAWVENTLSSKGAWPPKDLSFLKDDKFDYNGERVPALDHPGLRRNLCMMMGRLNSMMLNTHPELCTLKGEYFNSAVSVLRAS